MESISQIQNSQWISLYERGKIHKPGVYYDMPREEYHADYSLSSSGIRNLLVSPLDYWVNSPLNPDYEEEKTDAKDFGTAFHSRILEGREKFDAAYASELDISTLGKDVLKTGDQLRAKCTDLGCAKNGTLLEMADRIVAADPTAICFAHLEAKYNKMHEGKTFMPARAMRRIELAAQAIESSPELMEMLDGTEREVSVFWVDQETGVPMKARLDAFKPGLIIDPKTFANMLNKPLTLAITGTIAQRAYGIQAITYKDGLKQALGHDARFMFIFVESGSVPNVLAKEYAPHDGAASTAYFEASHISYRHGIQRWKECFETYGESAWISPAKPSMLVDTDFPSWVFDSREGV